MNARNLFLAVLAVTGFAASANAQITGSKHDFSSYGWSTHEICKPCHTPHFSNEAVGRLWNHTLTTATYTMHRGSGTAELNLDSRSRMCLSCHDGTVALDSFGGAGAPGGNTIPTGALIGTNLNNDHPIGSDAVYPTSGTSTSFRIAVPSASGTSATVTNGSLSLRVRPWVDSTGATKFVVACSSCHTVHNTGNNPHMTAVSNDASKLCLVCHIK